MLTRPTPNSSSPRRVQLMDTTLRDGEQTPDVAFSLEEKLLITEQLLEQVGVDRVEICSARVSPAEQRTAARIAEWADARGRTSQIEALAFVDGASSVEWLRSAGVLRMNLLVKGSELHCRLQLRVTPEQHRSRIRETLAAAERAGVQLSGVYLEDWSRGCRESPAYVAALLETLQALGVPRIYLADTLGVLGPPEVLREVRRVRRDFPGLACEFHAHDDYGLATANCLAAVRAGASGLHTTVNGLGERAGNACLAQVAVALKDHAGCSTGVDEARLMELSRRVAQASGLAVAHNAPLLGPSVFTQTAGIHADGDAKASLYCSRLAAERFTRRREYALGKLSGKASLSHHLRELGLDLDAVLSPEAQSELLEQLRVHVVELAGRATETYEPGCDRAGCDRAGCNRAGCDRAGCNRAGCDRAGCDRAGCNRAGCETGARKQRVRASDLQAWLAPRMLR
jgi:D-citramalate synthase